MGHTGAIHCIKYFFWEGGGLLWLESFLGVPTESGIVAAVRARGVPALSSGRRDWGGMRAVPSLLSYTLAFALQLRKNNGKTSVGVARTAVTNV
jgi:hypothetical protein